MDRPLPVEASIGALVDALGRSKAAVLVAPPGSGKTTVVPLRLLEHDGRRRIVMLEPRRIATRAAARRMATLRGDTVGGTIGYVTRDDRRVSPQTRVEVVTEGVLTRRLQRDPELPGVTTVIFDEFHERNLQSDLGLALLLDVRRTIRPDVEILVMSATIDAGRIAALIGDTEPAPVVTSDAREHAVEVRWMPMPKRGRLEPHLATAVTAALDREVGDVLAFLPGMGEMRRVADLLEERSAACEVHLLHGSLPIDTQDAAITPSHRRKVVLSTDIAETSLTVEGVSIVVDSGLARAPRFDARTGMTRLQTIPISRASADQRAGRAGRIGPGVAYRLWSKIEHGTRRAHVDAEITQVDLAALVLELYAWGEPDPGRLRFLDRPPPKAWSEAANLLARLGALDGGGLTPLGRRMTTVPAHPRLARMILEAGRAAWTACLLAALIEERDPLRGPVPELPVDLGLRLGVVAGARGHANADGRTIDRVRRVAADIARRAEVQEEGVDPDTAGAVLALAFPDRLAVRRGSPGRFQLRTGTSAWMSNADPLAVEPFLVVADLDGKRRDARIRLAASLDAGEVMAGFGPEIDTQRTLAWSGPRVVEKVTSRIGGIDLEERETRAAPSAEVTRLVVAKLSAEPALVPWDAPSASFRQRVAFLNRVLGQPWPDWELATLGATVADWLGSALADATGLDDVAAIDLRRTLERALDPRLRPELDRLAPTHVELPDGRRRPLDYSGPDPVLAAPVQDLFGVTSTPVVAGRPVVVHLLSPAGRPVQITQDLAGFWTGSWHQVRKEMAGRYPKHEWPENP